MLLWMFCILPVLQCPSEAVGKQTSNACLEALAQIFTSKESVKKLAAWDLN